jgi:ABC-type Fe3+/spermidine/putrescine transport system ATPase subunit
MDVRVGTGPFTLSCRREAAPEDIQMGEVLNVMIRPEDILVGDHDTAAAGTNVFHAMVKSSTFTGGRSSCELMTGDVCILAELHGQRILTEGERIKVGVPVERLKAFAR